LVETIRENGRTKQRIIRNFGRKEMVEARGDLDRLARSAARLSQRSMILSLIEDGGAPDVACPRIGAPLLFERLWQEGGCHAVVEGLLAGRRFEFAVERAVFLTVLHASWCRAPTVLASIGAAIIASTASTNSISIISIVPWLSWEKSCRRRSRPPAHSPRAVSRT
jgi:hypothetical protein